MNEDEMLQQEVQNAIHRDTLLNTADIGVTVKEAVVTLFGIVNNYSKTLEAQRTAKSVRGVKAVIENIEVRYFADSHMREKVKPYSAIK